MVEEAMGKPIPVAVLVVVMIVVIVGVDIQFLRSHTLARLIVNVGIVLVFVAIYFLFVRTR